MVYLEGLKTVGVLVVFGVTSYIQSVLFTRQSRARNQNDTKYFRRANIEAQTAYYIFAVTLQGTIWKALTTGNYWLVVLTGIVFVASSNAAAMSTVKKMIENGR